MKSSTQKYIDKYCEYIDRFIDYWKKDKDDFNRITKMADRADFIAELMNLDTYIGQFNSKKLTQKLQVRLT